MKSIFTHITIILAVITAVVACESVVLDKQIKAEASYNNCPYEGLECPNAQAIMEEHNHCVDSLEQQLRDYQITVYMDTVWLYEGRRLVGTYVGSLKKTQLGKLIIKDNL